MSVEQKIARVLGEQQMQIIILSEKLEEAQVKIKELSEESLKPVKAT